jgi:SdpC family antimicrobial peptide
MSCKISRYPIFLAFAHLSAAAMLAQGCGADASPARRSRPSGEELFRGIILASGPVADSIPEIRDHRAARNLTSDPEKLAMIEAAHDLLIGEISLQQPAFFDRYQKLIESGDELQVQRSFLEGARVLVEALKSIDRSGKVRDELQNPSTIENAVRAEAGRRGAKVDPELLARVRSGLATLSHSTPNPQAAVGQVPDATTVVLAVVAVVYVVAAVDLGVVVNVVAVQAGGVAVVLAISQAITVTSSSGGGTSTSTSTSASTATADSGGTSTSESTGEAAIRTAPELVPRLRVEMMIHSIAATFARPGEAGT